MEETTFSTLLVAFVMNTAIIAGAPLLVATVVGLLVSIFQAITQIQDQTLSQTIKIFSIGFVFLAFGGALMSPLIVISAELFDTFATIGR
jgi:type III secretory pathway component EscS